MMASFGKFRAVVLLLAVLGLGGCAGSSVHMREVADQGVQYTPKQGQALVVFMRPSRFGFAIQSSVFDVTQQPPRFIAIVPAGAKVAFDSEAGLRLFMVVGESADFMAANLAAGKTYYALVTPRMGLWKARFSLRPVTGAELAGGDFADWESATRWNETVPSALKWAKENMASIISKHDEYIVKWKAKSDKPLLRATDGR